MKARLNPKSSVKRKKPGCMSRTEWKRKSSMYKKGTDESHQTWLMATMGGCNALRPESSITEPAKTVALILLRRKNTLISKSAAVITSKPPVWSKA
jgi:hypothetical protein